MSGGGWEVDVIQARRRLLMQDTNKCPYITDGLVLWMDGIKKGNVTGAWVDQIAGHVFQGVNDPEFGSDYIATDAAGNSYLTNTSLPPYRSENATIEVALSDHISSTQLVFMPQTGSGGVAFGFYGRETIIWASDTRRYMAIASHVKTASVNNSNAMVNGIAAAKTGSDVWVGGSSSTSYIGRRNSGNPYTGKIHAIRIYNRILTPEEMLFNQRIDNKRFNLGLTI